jgi:circadian clock protein KaiC
MSDRVVINRLPTGVPGLDEVLGGGIPEFSFNLIAGSPGAGKTTLAQQIMFGLARPERPALYFTVIGEPPMKMLRYQQQFSFFDVARLDDCVRYINLSQEVIDGSMDEVLARIIREVEAANPGIVVVDSFRTVARGTGDTTGEALGLQHFVQHLAVQLSSWQATTFLVGEYHAAEAEAKPVLTVADGLLWLSQSVNGNAMVRTLQVTKMRGQAPIPGLHTFRITDDGVQVFPRVLPRSTAYPPSQLQVASGPLLSTGVAGVDEMLGGGIPPGYAVLVSGPSGSGKTLLARAFLAAGARAGEPGILVSFGKRPDEYANGGGLGAQFRQHVIDGRIAVVQPRPLDLSVDEMLYEIQQACRACNATRLVIDSLSGFELALASTFREDFREALYRMMTVLTSSGVTIMMTAEVSHSSTELQLSPHGTAFLADALIVQRYTESDRQLRRVMTVLKVRGAAHSDAVRPYAITGEGLVVDVNEPL